MQKKIYTYGLLIILMALLSISAAYMVPDEKEVEQIRQQNGNPGGSGFRDPKKVKVISSKKPPLPETSPAGKVDKKPPEKHNPPIPTKEPGD